MRNKIIWYCGLVMTGLLLANTAGAFDMGNMMNPSKWMGGNRNNDRYDDDYYGEPGYGYPGGYGGAPGYGYGGLPGYGYGGDSGYGYGGLPGYGGVPGYGTGYGGAPGYGTGYGGAPGYGTGYGGVPGYGYGTGYGGAPAAAPQTDNNAAEIKRLKERVRQLENPTTGPEPVWGQQGYQYR